MVIVSAISLILVIRLLPESNLEGFDLLIGRTGDSVLLLAILALVAALFFIQCPPPADKKPTTQDNLLASAEAIFEQHLRIDEEIDKRLNEVTADTEHSALFIITQMRQLYDNASRVVQYLEGTNLKAGDLGQAITDSVERLMEVNTFISQLPAKIERDLESVQTVVSEFKEMNGLIESVQAISMQSHMLAINAAIEASRAGVAGRAFKVVADEVRSLASNSSKVATLIKEGLTRASSAVNGGMASSIAESSQQLQGISLATASISILQENFADMSQYYKTRFTVVTKHNEDLAKDISEVLGQIQYQDVVRQSVERIRTAIVQRNLLLQSAIGEGAPDPDLLRELPERIDQLKREYLVEDARHVHLTQAELGNDAGLKIELF